MKYFKILSIINNLIKFNITYLFYKSKSKVTAKSFIFINIIEINKRPCA